MALETDNQHMDRGSGNGQEEEESAEVHSMDWGLVTGGEGKTVKPRPCM